MFAWAPFRSTKAAIKLHTLLDLRGNIPSFIHITDGKTHEVNVMDDLVLEPGAFYLMDRGYLDFSRLFVIHEAQACFVTRAKSNTKFKRRYSHPVDRINTAVLCDQTGVLTTHYSSKDYPATLRRVVIGDNTGKRLLFLTNNFALNVMLVLLIIFIIPVLVIQHAVKVELPRISRARDQTPPEQLQLVVNVEGQFILGK